MFRNNKPIHIIKNKYTNKDKHKHHWIRDASYHPSPLAWPALALAAVRNYTNGGQVAKEQLPLFAPPLINGCVRAPYDNATQIVCAWNADGW